MIRHIPQRIVLVILLVGLFAMGVFTQSGVDPTFNAVLSNPLPTDASFQQVIQPDGKIIVYNAPAMSVNGELRSGIFRLNPDGSTDSSFNVPDQGGVGIYNLMVAPDGKIVLAGSTGPNHAKMVRLNPDGSLDNAFSVFIQAVGSPDFTGNWLEVNGIQPDGKVIATHGSWGNIQGTWYSYSMRRYNLDGSIDSSFQAPTLNGGHLVITSTVTEMLPDGRFYLAVTSRSLTIGGTMTLSRRLANGSADSTYAPFSASMSSTSFLTIVDLARGNDGGVLATGVFQQTAAGFPPVQQLRKYLADGGLGGLNAPTVMSGSGVHELANGKVLYSASGGNATRPLMRLEPSGAVDTTFQLDPAITSIKNKWQVDPMERPVFLADTTSGPRLVRLLDNGNIDPAFSPVLGAPGVTNLLAVQPDGKVLMIGGFTGVSGTPRNQFARVNADGSYDPTFDQAGTFNIAPRQMVVQPDGKILAVGIFSIYNGSAVTGCLRLNSNGSVDGSFSVNLASTGIVEAIALQPDGKILIGGTFTSVDGTNRPGLARIQANGALDPTFNPSFSNPSIKSIIVEPSGKITIGGTFTDGAGRSNVARLEANGSFDAGFVASVPEIAGLWRQFDGKYLYTVAGNPRMLLRTNVDGSADLSFSSPNVGFGSSDGVIRSVVPMPDGTMIVGGRFNKIGTFTKWHLTRLFQNGANDPTFLTTGANNEVFALAPYSSNKVMVSGSFTWIDSVNRSGIARLNIIAVQRKVQFDFDGDGRSDISVVRPSTNRWYEVLSATGAVHEETFGLSGDVLAPGDFDGDGITDESIFRPSNGQWWYRSSITNALILNPGFGGPGDIPRPSDFDGDGRADLVLFRPSNNTWYRLSSATNQEVAPLVFGLAGDQPIVGDFDGDGKSDPAVFRPSSGNWWYAASSAGGAFRTGRWGQNGDIPVPADYDGDSITDFAVYRPSDGGWYIYNSGTGSFTTTAFGTNGDRPVAADYDGDGRADLAVFRPSTGIWYLLRSTSGFAGYQFGISTDVALPGSLIP